MNRIERLQKIIHEYKAHAILVTNAKNIFYLTGFIGISPHERESTCLVTTEKTYLFVPKMYEEKARKLDRDKKLEIIVDHERYGLLTSFVRFVDPASRILCESTDLRIAELENIRAKTGLTLDPQQRIIEPLRMIKDNEEIALLKKACSITEQVYDGIVRILQSVDDVSELTELDIADAMRSLGREYGADGFGFDPIVALGAHAAEPHYITGNTPLEMGQCLLMDFGFQYKGYTADLTRTIFLGKADDGFTKIYNLVKENNQRCIEAVKPGVTTKELFELSVKIFKEKELDQHYLHSLGHGFGLDVHEAPSVGSNKETPLEPGMVITIEPGLYFAGGFGVRIEDDVLVTEDGYELLTTSSKDLLEIAKN